MKKLASLLAMGALFASASVVFARVDPNTTVVVNPSACTETTVTASIPGGFSSTLYLVVDTEGDTEQSAAIPTNGDEVSLSVGPFTEDTSVYWRVFGGGERDWDIPLWNHYGEANFGTQINEYYNSVGTWDWVLAGTDDPNPFTTWNQELIPGCAPVKVGKATGGLMLDNPWQQISFSAFDNGYSGFDKGEVEYQNFEYPGGLHYTAQVMCANVDPVAQEATFMFQIPEGWPGLSGRYVVASVTDGGTPGTNGDMYRHTSTTDLSTALDWCENGAGGTSYQIVGGNLVVHK